MGGTFRERFAIEYYNVAEDAWTEGPMMNHPRYDFSSTILNGMIYSFCGESPIRSFIERLDAKSLVNGQNV